MDIEKMLMKCEYLLKEENAHPHVFKKVVKSCTLILEEDRKNQKALYYMACALYQLKSYKKSLNVIDRALKIDPKNSKFQEIRMKALLEADVNSAFKYFKASKAGFFSDGFLFEGFDEKLASKLVEAEEYEKALFCYEKMLLQNKDSIEAIDGIKRVMNKSDLDITPAFDDKYYMKWIFTIKSKSDKMKCPVCGEEIEGSGSFCSNCEIELPQDSGVNIECDDIHLYEYANAQVLKVKSVLDERRFYHMFHRDLDYMDDGEYGAFMNRLKDIEFIFDAGSGSVGLLDETMSKHPEEGKYAAPRWLVYPELSAWTIGWRMGYGEDYAMNAPWYGPESEKLFPKPLNWLFKPQECRFKHIPLLGYMWTEDGKPKYSQIGRDYIVVNDFITLTDEGDFRHNQFTFTSVEHGILFAKVGLFHVDEGTGKEQLEDLKPVKFSDDEEAYWQNFKYTVCLNVLYYKVMQDEELKERLLATGDKSLVYESDDEWGGEENLFGFALMELRDEIRRLYKNEGLIDWKFTEYLKYKNPYANPKPRNPEDEQSPEYKVIESVINSASRYVRDIDLKPELAEKYEVGQIITERAFVDASSRIGGMVTSHRYLILSQWMTDLSRFDEGRNWGMHVGKRDSKFKVIDIYTVDGKTQIALLHLPDGFEEVFENTISLERDLVERIRMEFEEALKLDPIEELATSEWLERCSFPLGMSDDGEFF